MSEPNLLAEHRWDNTSAEAEFHKRLGFLSKKHQGLVMHHFREVLRNQVREKIQACPYLIPEGRPCPKCGDVHKDKDSY